MLNTTVCALCLVEEEFCQHLFVECKCARRVWNMCFKWIGILFVQHNNIAANLEGFSLTNDSKKTKYGMERGVDCYSTESVGA